jgi:hypothetical protein
MDALLLIGSDALQAGLTFAFVAGDKISTRGRGACVKVMLTVTFSSGVAVLVACVMRCAPLTTLSEPQAQIASSFAIPPVPFPAIMMSIAANPSKNDAGECVASCNPTVFCSCIVNADDASCTWICAYADPSPDCFIGDLDCEQV